EKDLYAAQLDLILDPNDPQVIAAARQQGIPPDWLDAARRSPVYALAKTYKVALPLHPEYPTTPMVWYIPPLPPPRPPPAGGRRRNTRTPGPCGGSAPSRHSPPSSTYYVIKVMMPSLRVSC